MARLSVSATIELTRSNKSNKDSNGLKQKLEHIRRSISEKTSRLLKKSTRHQSSFITSPPAATGTEHNPVVESICRRPDTAADIRRKPVPSPNQYQKAPVIAETQTDSTVETLETNFRALTAQLEELRKSLEALGSRLLEHEDGHSSGTHFDIEPPSSVRSSRGKTTYRNAAIQTEVEANTTYNDAAVQTESQVCACNLSKADTELSSLHDTKLNSKAASTLLGKRSQKVPACPAVEEEDVDIDAYNVANVGADRESIASDSERINASPPSSWMMQAVNGGRLGSTEPQQSIKTVEDDGYRQPPRQQSKTEPQLGEDEDAGDVGGDGNEVDGVDGADTEIDTSPSSSNDQQGGADLAALDPAITAHKILSPPSQDETVPVLHPDWSVVRKLRSGAQGRVCIVKHNHTGEMRVAKTLKLIGGNQAAVDSSTSTEVYFLKNLTKHRNIIRLLSDRAILAQDAPYFVQEVHYEYCEGGDLGDMIEKFFANDGRMPSLVVAHVFSSMLSALAYLHFGLVQTERGWIKDDTWWTGTILHRDIKPDNIFLRPGDNATGLHDVVLGDFGLAAVEGDCTVGGTECFCAPEVEAAFKVQRADELGFAAICRPAILTTKSNAFSLGATIYTTMTNRAYHVIMEDRLLVSADGSPKHIEGESDGHKNILWTYVENLVRASPQRRSPSVAFQYMADELAGRVKTWTREMLDTR